MSKPFSKAEERKLKKLHGEGKSLTLIAKTLKRSTETISRHAKAQGLSFDRERTKKATEAHEADAAQLRSTLKLRLLHEAGLFLDQLHQPYTVYAFAGADGYFDSHELDKPPADQARNIMTSVGIALQRSLDLEKADQKSKTSTTVIDEFLAHLGVK
ncbi:MAG: helix-turn-helix domain-containing protein [Bifidobacteriaceae bacterium]|jgi:hypothetical protein|nr:helix-turn-helix domain-containing protein [Bifidobacteriaceae bacterium]